MGVYGFLLGHYLPVVLLGLLPRFLEHGVWIYWRSSPFRIAEYVRRAKSWFALDSRVAVQFLSGRVEDSNS